ncbi:RNA polymerase sigma70 [Cohnella kolymensis]|uniref:RNA polymerase sigma70 n=1 Tax=Cohnella kolymensis TaxID=1590652 RepID=A0ABR5A7M1_9BACL|nr:sugar-binding transcriptional regulator [Cohnella kolymensis]KIL37029.1 RNA polymerase sigma70 [Cohnella kolymensis]
MNQLKILVEAATLYYQLDYSQQEIAHKLGISRPTVSRLLQQAKQKGIVKIGIFDPIEDAVTLAEEIKQRFELNHCMIVSVASSDDQLIKSSLGKAAAHYLYDTVNDGDIIGVTWGTTLHQVAVHMKQKYVRDVKVVQLNGGVSYSETNTYAAEILNEIGKAFYTTPHFLPLPAIVDQAVVKQTIVADRHIQSVLQLSEKANIAIFTVGEFSEQSTLIRAGYFSKEDMAILNEKGAVGDICSRVFDKDGRICHPSLNDRTIGIELNKFKEKEKRILVAGGMNKVAGTYGALQGRYPNVLIIDQFSAKALLEMSQE